MNYNELSDIQEEIKLLLVKKKKNEIIIGYLKRIKPKDWKNKMQNLVSNNQKLDSNLSSAYVKLDDLFNNKS